MNITNECNMELMSRYEDNHFDLAIVDPPYGIGDKFKGGKSGKMNFNEVVDKGWDNEIPSKEYFAELKRVSKNQIIWGGNYFLDNLGNTRCFICWDKKISPKLYGFSKKLLDEDNWQKKIKSLSTFIKNQFSSKLKDNEKKAKENENCITVINFHIIYSKNIINSNFS